jgi:hypothetical protein
MITPPICPTCKTPARLTDGAEIYKHRKDLRWMKFWKCDSCGAYCGCHPGTTKPLGVPAGPDLRRARALLHAKRIDPLWRGARVQGARSQVYAYLAAQLGIASRACHAGLFDIEQCRKAWRVLTGITYSDVATCAKDNYHEAAE